MTIKVKGISDVDGRTVEVRLDEKPSGDGPSVMKKVTFDFAFDSPGLKDGIPVFNPKVGEVLYDAYFVIETPFDGTTPVADLTVIPVGSGMFGMCYNAYKLYGAAPSNGVSNDNRAGAGSLLNVASANGIVPAQFFTSDPFMLYVTQDGKCDGTGIAIDSTFGSAKLVLLVV